MSGESSREVLRHLNTLFHCGAAGPLSDEELLERFVAGEDEAAEAAFAALVNRHGAMVLGVCRRVLGNRHAAEDAFQATFLVLARKAPAIARREQLASWLHGVARRTALDARGRVARQQAREKRLGAILPVKPPDQTLTRELRAILDEELGRLPERHRVAIVLCELEGLSRREAAGRLGVTEGTLSSRLARAKARLRDRLTRRGLALSTAVLASALTQDAQAVTVPPALVDSTIRVATLVAAGSSLAGVVSTSVVTLTEGVLKAMLLAKLKLVILGLAAVALFTTGVGVLAQERPSDEDRLKNVERKLDKVLEVLGGSSRRVTADAPVPSGVPVPPATTPKMTAAPAAGPVPMGSPLPALPAAPVGYPPPAMADQPGASPTPKQPAPSPGPLTAPAVAGAPAGGIGYRGKTPTPTGGLPPASTPHADLAAFLTAPPTTESAAGADAAPSPSVEPTPSPAIGPGPGGAAPSPDAEPESASPPSSTPRGN